jgi:gas vesicle protein
MEPKKELELVWDMLDRAMSVIDELTNQRPPHPRLENEIEDIQEEIFNIRGRIE